MSEEKIILANTEYGPVRGIEQKSVFGTDFLSFRGIPYMKAPLGSLRFRDAQAPKHWKSAFDATKEGPSYCMMDFMTGLNDGQENAGTINVYTKSLDQNKKYPVMVWIHGGSFSKGSSRTDLYGPDYLLEKDVIFVSLNYRLGPIGFLSLSDPELGVPGNTGLKDQVFALKWVQKNISNFGGDCENVTVFGESAGGCCVHYLTLSSLTKGLFNRAIIMSSCAFNKTWGLTPSDRNMAVRLARKLGWKGKEKNEKEILEFLENVSAFEMVDASKSLITEIEEHGEGAIVPFGPTIEPYITDNCFLPKDSVLMARDTWSNEKDVMVTVTSFEGLLRAFVGEDIAAQTLQNSSYFIPLIELGLDACDPVAKKHGQKIKELYYGDLTPSIENQEQYLRFQSDFHFFHGIHRTVLSRSNHATGKTFFLRFNVDGGLNLFKALKKTESYKGSSHADDLFYLFKTDYHDAPKVGTDDFKTIKRMVGIFTGFAINGDPNCSEIEEVVWKQQRESSPSRCIEITEKGISEVDLPEYTKMQIWDSIYNEQHVPLF